MLYELASLSIRNLTRARARLLMTSGGVMIGTTAVVLLIALTIGLQAAAEAGIGNSASLTQITIRAPFRRDATASPTLNNDAVTQLSQLPDVAAVIPMLQLSGQVQLKMGNDTGSAQVYGIDPTTLAALGSKAQTGTLTLDDTTPYAAVAGASVASSFVDQDRNYVTGIDLTTSSADMQIFQNSSAGRSSRKVPLTFNAVLQTGSVQDTAIYLPMSTILDLNQRVTGSHTDASQIVYTEIIVQASSRETASSVSDAITALGYNASGMGTYLSQLNGFFGIMRLMLGGVGAVALLVAAFGVANTMTMAILERTREIGLMKAVGATDRDILTIFLLEAGLVGLIGGIAGLTLSYLLGFTINTLLADAGASASSALSFLNVSSTGQSSTLVVIPIELAAFALALATCIGICAGMYPSLRAARMLTVLALKSD